MIVKKREKPLPLLIMTSLNNRMVLSREQYLYYLKQLKGYKGECRYDTMTDKLTCDCLILDDLQFRVNGVSFQIDKIIITGDAFLFYDVKNYEGEFIYESDKMIKLPTNHEIVNPFVRVNRHETLLRQLMKEWHVDIELRPYLVFVNPEYTLYQAPYRADLILPTAIETHLQKVNRTTSRLYSWHHQLAGKLRSLHQEDRTLLDIPDYTYEELTKGATCMHCGKFFQSVRRIYCRCDGCGQTQQVKEVILFHAQEFSRLFPDCKLTTAALYEWCGQIFSHFTIRAVLEEHYQRHGENRWAWYV